MQNVENKIKTCYTMEEEYKKESKHNDDGPPPFQCHGGRSSESSSDDGLSDDKTLSPLVTKQLDQGKVDHVV